MIGLLVLAFQNPWLAALIAIVVTIILIIFLVWLYRFAKRVSGGIRNLVRSGRAPNTTTVS